jgi:hypothetical protein
LRQIVYIGILEARDHKAESREIWMDERQKGGRERVRDGSVQELRVEKTRRRLTVFLPFWGISHRLRSGGV